MTYPHPENVPWHSEYDLDNETVAGLIGDQFPELMPIRITGRYQGWDHQAVEIDGRWIFRFPKRAECVMPFRRELALLPQIDGRIPVTIPRYRFFGRPSVDFPYPFAGYPRLPGAPADMLSLSPEAADRLAPTFGAILSSIHMLPPELALNPGLDPPPEENLPAMQQDVLEKLPNVLEALSETAYRAVSTFLKRDDWFSSGDSRPRRLLHGDFGPEHLLLNPVTHELTALIDWTDAFIGDPAYDFSYLWPWRGEEFVEQVLASYSGEIDSGFRKRLRFYGVCSAVEDLHYGLLTGAAHNRDVGLAALQRFGCESKLS